MYYLSTRLKKDQFLAVCCSFFNCGCLFSVRPNNPSKPGSLKGSAGCADSTSPLSTGEMTDNNPGVGKPGPHIHPVPGPVLGPSRGPGSQWLQDQHQTLGVTVDSSFAQIPSEVISKMLDTFKDRDEEDQTGIWLLLTAI